MGVEASELERCARERQRAVVCEVAPEPALPALEVVAAGDPEQGEEACFLCAVLAPGALLERIVQEAALPQISVVAGSPTSTNFPEACCEAIFLQDVYHHFTQPAAMNASILRSLKPGGRLAIVDFTPPPESGDVAPADRAKDGSHGVRPKVLERELSEAGFEGFSVDSAGNRWFLVVARKPAAPLQVAKSRGDR